MIKLGVDVEESRGFYGSPNDASSFERHRDLDISDVGVDQAKQVIKEFQREPPRRARDELVDERQSLFQNVMFKLDKIEMGMLLLKYFLFSFLSFSIINRNLLPRRSLKIAERITIRL